MNSISPSLAFSLRFFASPSGFLIREEIQRSLTARGPWALHTFRKNSAIEHFILFYFLNNGFFFFP